MNYIIILPTYGKPYIFGKTTKSKSDNVKLLQRAVQGDYDTYDRNSFVIHPMFADECPRWAMAQKILAHPKTNIYVNDNGVNECGVNTSTVIINKYLRYGGCPHLWGDVALEISEKNLKALDIRPETLTMIERCFDEDGELNVFEPEDTDDEENMIKLCKENNYDYIEYSGQIYKQKI